MIGWWRGSFLNLIVPYFNDVIINASVFLQVARIYRDRSIGNLIKVVLVKIFMIESDLVRKNILYVIIHIYISMK